MKVAGVFRITPNYATAVANMIISIERHSPNLFTEYVVFTSEASGELDQIKEVCHFFNKKYRFEVYDTGKIRECIGDIYLNQFFKRYPLIVFSLFGIFTLLKDFDLAIALDADMIVIDDISSLLTYDCGICFRKSRKLADIFKDSKDENEYTPNAGVIVFSNQILNYQDLEVKAIDILVKNIARMNGGYEEATLRLLIDEQKIPYKYLPLEFNCPIGHKDSDMAKIIHYMKVEKPWESEEIAALVSDYVKNIHLFHKITQNRYKNFNIGNITLFQQIRRIKFAKLNQRLYHHLIQLNLSSNCYPELNVRWPYLTFYIKGLPKKVHIDVRYELTKDGTSKWNLQKDPLGNLIQNISICCSIDEESSTGYSGLCEMLVGIKSYKKLEYKWIRYNKNCTLYELPKELNSLSNIILNFS